MKFVVDAESCVACLACARVCPTGAIAVPPDGSVVRVIEESCIRCGLCLPSCPHDAIEVTGEIGRALAIAALGEGVLILGSEAPAHFYPATPEQVVNACYAVGFRTVSRGVLGDELVAMEYLRLWEEENWGTMIRSTDQVVVDAIRTQYPELVPFLAPIATPVVAEARYLRHLGGSSLPVVYAGVSPTSGAPELDASITFGDLEQVFALRGVNPLTQPVVFERVPMERRRHLSAAGGLPLAMLEEARHSSRRFHKIRGLDGLKALARAIAVDRIDLGFVDILASEGSLDHPLSGPREELYWRRWVVQNAEPPRSRIPVVETGIKAAIGAVFQFHQRPAQPDPVAVRGVLDLIGTGPNGRAWDCRACGYTTCQRFAEAVVAGRAALRLCVPYLERAAEESQRAAATDLLTGLASFRVLRDRLVFEAERSKRSGEKFAVLFFDLDRLKEFNDRFGHEAGNDVLRAVATEMRNAVRASDLAARYGGDEFVVILTRTDEAGARRVAEVLREGFERVGQRLGYGSEAVTVSVGIAEYDPADPSAGDPLVNADRALYKAKAMGRNKVV